MAELDQNWLTKGHIDFEYKKYILLAYLKEVGENFEQNKLYPSLSELIEHYKQALAIKENKDNLHAAFPKKLSKINLKQLMLSYEKLIEDSTVMKELESIIDYSLPKFQAYLKEGKEIYDFIEEQLHISPVGVVPLQSEYGYLLLRSGNVPETKAYQFQISIFEQPDERYRGIITKYIGSFKKTYSNTFESIKTSLLNQYKQMANPATYAIETEMNFPFEETFLPIAKRAIVKYVAVA